MDSTTFDSTVELTREQQKARELDRLDDEYKVLTRERDHLRGFLTDITRLLDDPANSASRLETLEDIKVTYERRFAEKEALMGEKMRCMTWLRRPGGRFSLDKDVLPKAEDNKLIKEMNAPKGSSADESSAGEKFKSEKSDGMADLFQSAFKILVERRISRGDMSERMSGTGGGEN